jgi:serine/threonine protein kinase
VTRLLGQGGMGVVYEAEHVQLGKKVAIKLLLDKYADDAEAVARFQREALMVSQIGNQHIIDVVDIGTSPDGRSFVVLELLSGMDLGVALAEGGPMSAKRAIHIMKQVLVGIGAAHERGIVHRDLKPDNIFLVTRGAETDFVKILDFGISKILAAADAKVRLTSTGTVVGTPIYMAPEQALGGTIDHRVDLYAAGVMFYELLAGRPPFDAPSYIALVTQHLHSQPPPLSEKRPDLPTWLIAVVHRALEKDPNRRFADAAAFNAAMPSNSAMMAVGDVSGLGTGQVPALPTLPGLSATQASSRASTSSQSRNTPRRSQVQVRKSRAPWIALGCGLVAAATAVTIVLLSNANHASGAKIAATPVPSPIAPVAAPIIAPIEKVTHGDIDIKTEPPGAAVYIDDKQVGITPLSDFSILLGEHMIRLELDGYGMIETKQEVSEKSSPQIMVVMSKVQPATTATPIIPPPPQIKVSSRPPSHRPSRPTEKPTKPGQNPVPETPVIAPEPPEKVVPKPEKPDPKPEKRRDDGDSKSNPFSKPSGSEPDTKPSPFQKQ